MIFSSSDLVHRCALRRHVEHSEAAAVHEAVALIRDGADPGLVTGWLEAAVERLAPHYAALDAGHADLHGAVT